MVHLADQYDGIINQKAGCCSKSDNLFESCLYIYNAASDLVLSNSTSNFYVNT